VHRRGEERQAAGGSVNCGVEERIRRPLAAGRRRVLYLSGRLRIAVQAAKQARVISGCRPVLAFSTRREVVARDSPVEGVFPGDARATRASAP